MRPSLIHTTAHIVFVIRRLVLATVFSLACFPVLAQAPFHVWLDRFPNTNNSIGPATHEITFDGGFVTAGNISAQTALNICKFSKTGILEWSKDVAAVYGCAAFAVIQLKDSGYAAVGVESSNSSPQVYLVRTDKNGGFMWAKTYSGGSAGYWIKQTLDGGLIIGGSSGSGYQGSCLIKTDINGTIQWSKHYAISSGSAYLTIHKGIELSDSSYILGGNGDAGVVLFKTDKKGVVQWTRGYTMGSAASSYTFSMRQTRDNGFIMIGTDSRPTWYAIKTDSAGAVQWSKTYKPTFSSANGYCFDVEEVAYGYVIVGSYNDNGVGFETSYVVKVMPDGNILWVRTFDEKYHDWLFSVRQTADKGLIIWGHTQIDPGSYQRGSLIKTDSSGLGTCKYSTQDMVATDFISTKSTPSLNTSSGGAVVDAPNTYSGSSSPIQYFPCAIPPAAKFKASDSIICSGSSITFHDLSLNTPASWKWTFENGSPNSSTSQNPVITYDTPGNYNVKLVVTNPSGKDSLVKSGYIIVSQSPIAGTLHVTNDTICEGTLAHLFITGNSNDSIQWQSSPALTGFTDIAGATSSDYISGPLTLDTYYHVAAVNGSCSDTTGNQLVVVIAPPIASFFASINNLVVVFNSDNSVGAIGYSWDFGDSSAISTEANPTHQFATTGTYHVCLTEKNNSNCNFTLCKNIILTTDGINEINRDYRWLVYPNPFESEIFINTNTADKNIRRIEVYDVLGRMIIKKNIDIPVFNPLALKVPDLNAGIYYLRIITTDTNYIQNIFKQ